ncbi:hypothetical protein SEA_SETTECANDELA_196 [Mycobacterium phage Settecandela]|nr:hypothetical protein SEA_SETTECANDELA_196 [Mycobacterium phage Settecandela]
MVYTHGMQNDELAPGTSVTIRDPYDRRRRITTTVTKVVNGTTAASRYVAYALADGSIVRERDIVRINKED